MSVKPVVVVASGGAIATALLPYHLVELSSLFDISLACALSPGASEFVSSTALCAITGSQVYTEDQKWHHEAKRPIHLVYSEADALVVFPATARIIVECALGSVTCPVTRLVAFAPREKIIFGCALHPRMDPRVYTKSLRALRDSGALCVMPEKPTSNVWPIVVEALRNSVGLKELDRGPEVRSLF